MSRPSIPPEVSRQLRQEVHFGCPVPLRTNLYTPCGNPYLHYHHFDPPWCEEEHFNPAGMIALCSQHHGMADHGAYTRAQLHEFKHLAATHGFADRAGRFEWMRRSLVAAVGGSLFYETRTPMFMHEVPIVWLNRDEEGYILVNFTMPTTSGGPRATMLDNSWVVTRDPTDLKCPPSGKLIDARYRNGEKFTIEFVALNTALKARQRYPEIDRLPITYPITAVEIALTVPSMKMAITAKQAKVGTAKSSGNVVMDQWGGFSIDV